MNRILKIILFFTLFLVLLSFRGYADVNEPVNFNTVVSISVIPNQTQWFNNATSIPSGSQYLSGQTYQFNITLETVSLADLKFNIFNTTQTGGNTVNINLSLSNGILNYSIIDNIKIYSVNILDLPVGNYSYIWNATDSFGQSNFTSYYIIIPKASTVTLTNSVGSWSITINSITLTCTVDSLLSLIIMFDGTNIATGTSPLTSPIITLVDGNHNFDCIMQGNSNYSYASDSHPLTVNTQSSTTTTTTTTTTTSTGSFTITGLPSSLSINAGESKATSFDIKNTLGYNLLKTNISLTGIDSSWYTFSNASISNLMRNTPVKITLTFNIPSDAEAKSYTIKVKAEGGVAGDSTKKTTEATMILTVASNQPSQQQVEETANQPINESINQTTNQTMNPTGLASIASDITSNIVLIVGFISAALVFIYREKITLALTKGKQIKPKVETTEKKTKISKPNIKMPKILNYKLNINLVKGTKEVKEEEDKNK